jgi:hypothetical protein
MAQAYDPQMAMMRLNSLSTHARQALARLQRFQTATHVYRTPPNVDCYGTPGVRRCSGAGGDLHELTGFVSPAPIRRLGDIKLVRSHRPNEEGGFAEPLQSSAMQRHAT